MSEEKPPFRKLGPCHDEVNRLVEKTRSRMNLAGALCSYSHLMPDEGFFTWDSVQAFANSVMPDTSYGGIRSDEAQVGAGETSMSLIGKPLLIGVSGGADSSMLLHLCVSLNIEDNSDVFSSIICCHVNHRLRGDESDEDARYCKDLSAKTGIRFVSSEADSVQAQVFKDRGGENLLREFRYAAFEGHAKDVGAQVVALAHTLSDQVETLLFRAFRGTSAAGLRGIPCLRRHNNVLIARPIIDVSRAQIERLLKALKLEWREDSSNSQLQYSRNFIRSELVPRIESEFPDFGSRIETMRQLIVDDEELLKTLCLSHISDVEGKNANSWQLAKLEPLPVALKRRMFAQALRERGIEVSFERVDKLVNMTVGNNQFESLDFSGPPTARALSLNERWDVVKRKDHLMFIDKEEKADQSEQADPIAVRVPGMTIVPAINKVMFVEALAPSETGPKRFPAEDAFEAVVSLANVQSPLVIRERQPGDCIQPFGMQETVKLKKYLHTHKQEDDEATTGRRRLYVLASGEEVLWVPGVGISEKLRVTGRPTHTLKLLDIGIGETTLC
ncbi:MAG: tRNA lysidine(34) synthetase TilS [Candidatus Melainabacteria bacterium]|nr:tRNA lysidine(34) synthetase TilS [Candidatus Melainabacteria bacterium]